MGPIYEITCPYCGLLSKYLDYEFKYTVTAHEWPIGDTRFPCKMIEFSTTTICPVCKKEFLVPKDVADDLIQKQVEDYKRDHFALQKPGREGDS